MHDYRRVLRNRLYRRYRACGCLKLGKWPELRAVIQTERGNLSVACEAGDKLRVAIALEDYGVRADIVQNGRKAVSLQPVAAGGAATGTVIAAYKISDGVEDGMKIAAKEKPEAFADSLSVLTWPVRWAAMIFILISGCWITKKWLEHKTTSQPKGNETWNSH